MLHTKFRGNRSTGSGEEDCGGPFCHMSQMLRTNFRFSPFPRRLHINLVLIGQTGLEKMFEIVDDGRRGSTTTDDRQTTDGSRIMAIL